MKKRVSKKRKSVTTDELAVMVQNGFADLDNKLSDKISNEVGSLRTELKADMKEMHEGIEDSMTEHMKTFRNDYDNLAFRVKKLEHKVFEKR